MTNLVINNIEYIDNGNGYYFKVEDGKKSRISKDKFMEFVGQSEPEVEDTEVQVSEEPLNDLPEEIIIVEDEQVAPKTMVKVGDIEQAYTDTVRKYMERGMVVNLRSMNGSSGEISKIDLTDKKDVYRIALCSETIYLDDEFFSGAVNVKRLTVEKFSDGYKDKSPLGGWDIIWNGDGEIVEQTDWYSPTYRSDCPVFFTDIKIIEDMYKVRTERRKSDSPLPVEYELPLPIDDIEQRTKVRDVARKHKGYMRVKRAHIAKVVRVVGGAVASGHSGMAVYRIYFTEECGKSVLEIGMVSNKA